MNFTSTRIITDDVQRLAAFYELVTGGTAEWPAPVFAEIVTPAATLALGHTSTVRLFAEGSAHAADNHTAIIEFQVQDVDAAYARLRPQVESWVTEPTDLPWGNRAILFRDPDGNLVNLYQPVTEAAIARFRGRHPSDA